MSTKEKNSPLISIIVPVYNVEKFLERCVNSLINQSYKKIEIILINDGSTDKSLNLCEKFKNIDPRIKVINQKNQGLSGARNSGVKFAQGEYLFFVDSDDWIEKVTIEYLLSFALKNNLKVVECNIIKSSDYINEKTNIPLKGIIETRENALQRTITNKSFSVWRKIYHHSILKDIHFIPGKIYEDIPYTLEVLYRTKTIGYLENRLYIYYNERESITKSPLNLKKLNSIDMILEVNKKSQFYNKITKEKANNLVFSHLRNTYNQLFLNKDLDSTFKYRILLRKLIKVNVVSKNNKLKHFLIIYLPFWLYSLLLKFNKI